MYVEGKILTWKFAISKLYDMIGYTLGKILNKESVGNVDDL